MARDCIDYLEAVPWEEAEEEEILRTIPHLGSQYEQILARLQPVDPTAVLGIFISAIRFATSSPPPSMRELKSSAQDQLEYMLTEDDDVPILAFDNEILSKMEMMKELIHYWVDASVNIVKSVEQADTNVDMLDARLKVVEVASKVLEATGFGNVILPPAKRLHVVKVWLPFVQRTRSLVGQVHPDGEESSSVRIDGEIWQNLESAFVSIVLTLPSQDQAEILAEWLRSEHVRYPDLTEAFEVWCYRSKVAKRRRASLGGVGTMT